MSGLALTPPCYARLPSPKLGRGVAGEGRLADDAEAIAAILSLYEGTLRDHYVKWGAFEDVIHYGILLPEWQAQRHPEIAASSRDTD